MYTSSDYWFNLFYNHILMLNLDPGESVILEVRKHWIVFVAYGFSMAIAAIAPIVAYNALLYFIPYRFEVVGNTSSLAMFAYCIWLLFLWMGFFVQWTVFYLDVWYVTEKRIIDVEQQGLFHREISSLRFDKIQDITINVRGLIATFLNFGDVKVQTAAEDSGSFTMTVASKPEQIRKVVFAYHNIAAERPHQVSVVTHANDI